MRPAKCTTQPHCRNCGKPIRKFIPLVNLGFHDPADMPQTREDVQRQSNRQVMSVRYHDTPDHGRRIFSATTWDGETYISAYFCADNTCGVDFAYRAAKARD